MRHLLDYRDRQVKLTEERWQHILLHREMLGMQEQVEETLRKPQQVMRSRSDTEAELLYRFYHGTIVGDKWLCVVVKYRKKDAFVLTAYLTDTIKAGELLWPKA